MFEIVKRNCGLLGSLGVQVDTSGMPFQRVDAFDVEGARISCVPGVPAENTELLVWNSPW